MKQARLKIKSIVPDVVLPQLFKYMLKFFTANAQLMVFYYLNFNRIGKNFKSSFKMLQNSVIHREADADVSDA